MTRESSQDDTCIERLLHIIDKSEAVTKSHEAVDQASKLSVEKENMKKEKNLMEEKYKANIISLQQQLQEMQKELTKYKSMSVELGGKQITLEEFEKKTLEQTQTDYKLEIERQVDAVLKNEPSWPQWFSEYVTSKINAGIDKGLNDIYWTNLRADIAKARKTEWPKFLDEYTRKYITPFCQSSIRNILTTLQIIQVQKRCDKCGSLWTYEIPSQNIAYLLSNPNIIVDCGDPQCKDWFIRHKLTISLGDLIRQIVGEPALVP